MGAQFPPLPALLLLPFLLNDVREAGGRTGRMTYVRSGRGMGMAVAGIALGGIFKLENMGRRGASYFTISAEYLPPAEWG